MSALERYTWRMLQGPGMFDIRGCGQYVRALEWALASGAVGLPDVSEHCKDLGGSCCFPYEPLAPHCPDGFSIGTYLVHSYGVGGQPEGYACALNWSPDQLGPGEAGEVSGDVWKMIELLSRTAGNLVVVPCDAARLNAGRSLAAIRFHGRFDQALSVVYRWVMGASEPDGPGVALRSLLASECAEIPGCDSWGLTPSGASSKSSNEGMARWVCGSEPLGNPVDRQRRWDEFVRRNYLHDYTGPARFEGFGPPVPYSDNPRTAIIPNGA